MERVAGSRERSPEVTDRLRALPSVEELAASLDGVSHEAAVRAARAVIEAAREALLAGDSPPSGGLSPLLDEARARLAAEARPHLRRVINATGVIVHTNLGRAPLADVARDAVVAAAEGYSNLEYDADAGERGSRQS
ncbi:MAG: L-seryl-tRNA(Ser) seleniumtransferase, partial [Thermoleophilaceae bacterium]|nr:L-seryl-tRNA(Ser) seleniumtransferase [Thermoleophilaceae bacterium]